MERLILSGRRLALMGKKLRFSGRRLIYTLAGISIFTLSFCYLGQPSSKWSTFNERACIPAALPIGYREVTAFPKEQYRYRMLLHPSGSDIWISDSVIANLDSGNFFESNVRGEILRLLRKIEAGGKRPVLFDVGANIGLHSLYFAALNYKVHAFEPQPTNLNLLRCSQERNRFKNLKVNGYGLSDRDEMVKMKIPESYNAGHAVVESLSGNDKGGIQLRTLDAYVAETGQRPDLLKIDVEGYEANVLHGFVNTLRHNPPSYILIEFVSEFLKRETPCAHLWLLKAFDYRIFHDGKELALDSFCQRSAFVDLLCVHASAYQSIDT